MLYKKINLKEGQKVFFTSDTHYGHKNICKGTTSWDLSQHGGDSSVRDFPTLEKMNSAIVDGINNMVGVDDYLIHLGDWSFGGIQNIPKLRERINCQNIILILGNHDHHIAYNNEGVRDLFSEVHTYLELNVVSVDGKFTTYNLFHFPITQWNKAHHGRIHLYGHVHGSYTAPDRSLDVGIDNAFKLFGEYRPFTQGDIDKYMEGREFIQRSHHNKNTN